MWTIEHANIPAYKNQDRWFAKQYQDGVIIGVFDGHGPSDETVDACVGLFPGHLRKQTANHTSALRKSFAEVAQATMNTKGGSTALVAMLANDGTCVFATLGDSLYVVKDIHECIVGPHHNISTNHVERAEAVMRGGIYEPGSPYIYNQHGGGLQCGRSFGDPSMGTIISKQPEITECKVHPGGWVACMSDGVLDPIQEKDEFAHSFKRFETSVTAKQHPAEIIKPFYRQKGDDATLIVARYKA